MTPTATRRLALSLSAGLGAVLVLLLGMRMQRSTPASTVSPAAVALPQPSWAAERTAAFREEQDALMRGELSPLARIGYAHLPPGETALTPDPSGVLSVPRETLPTEPFQLRVVVSAGGGLALHAKPAVRLDGKPVTEAALSKGQVIALGLLRFLVAGSPEDPALAIYDLGSAPRRAFAGLHYFPSDDRYRVAARLERYPQPRPIRLAASRGEDKELQAIGTLHFTLPGPVAESMEAYLEQPGSTRLFLIFRDATSGQPGGSYGAGRFLYAALENDAAVWLDFNQAWNPLCAYSPYFHCPLPPRSNWLRSALPVGEKAYAEH